MVQLGKYRLVRQVGAGGMAEVWKARTQGPGGFQKTVAIKRALPMYDDNSDAVAMFAAEACIGAVLVHPNIVQVHDFGCERRSGQEIHDIAMEYVAGQSLAALRQRLREHGESLPLGIALYVCAEAAKALAYAHSVEGSRGRPLGLVHRDISPHNLMVTYSADVKVADFGIAKVQALASTKKTLPGVLKGKLAYMSPEQAMCKPLDARSDIFSLGIVMFELVTGTRLFSGSGAEVLAQARGFEFPNHDRLRVVPLAVQEVLRKALAKAPEGRYQDAAGLEADLNRVMAAGRCWTARADLAAMMREHFGDEIAADRQDVATHRRRAEPLGDTVAARQ